MSKRTILAFIAAPLVAALLFALSIQLMPGNSETGLLLFLVTTATVFPYALLFTIVIGGPLFLVLNRLNLVRWWSASVAGAVVGLVGVLLLRTSFMLTTVVGVGAGLVFWLIWKPVTPPNNRWRGP